MSNQYEVLGKAPDENDLKNLSPKDVHLTIKGLNAGYGKMEKSGCKAMPRVTTTFWLPTRTGLVLGAIQPIGYVRPPQKSSWHST